VGPALQVDWRDPQEVLHPLCESTDVSNDHIATLDLAMRWNGQSALSQLQKSLYSVRTHLLEGLANPLEALTHDDFFELIKRRLASAIAGQTRQCAP